MKINRDVSNRMREMLSQDKIVISEGFVAAMKGDLGKLLDGYFKLSSPIAISIERGEDDSLVVRISFCASDARRFETTMDILKTRF